MEYVAMLNEPDLVRGLEELLVDPDHTVIKRTIRVFANVYRHAFELLATGELDYDIFKNSLPAVKSVSNALIVMIPNVENEGVLVHLVRYLEASTVSHLMSDISRYTDLINEVQPLCDKGIEALISLISTPYVGGSVFIVGIRSLITIACYKNDIRNRVIVLIKKFIKSPPATLFDHNVRSFRKILQRNLFRLLRRSECDNEKRELIEMMVGVGVHRKRLQEWTPPPESRKRPLAQTTNLMDEVMNPPTKRAKTASPPSSGRSTPEQEKTKSSKDNKISGKENTASKSIDEPQEYSSNSLFNELQKATLKNLKQNEKEKPKQETSKVNLNFELLKNIINANAKAQSDKEKLQDLLTHNTVVDLVLACINQVPNSAPENLAKLFKEEGLCDRDSVNVMKERTAKLLINQLTKEQINEIFTPKSSERKSVSPPADSPTTPQSPSQSSTPPLPPRPEITPPLPSSTPPFSTASTKTTNNDVDLRQLLGRKDVDMRLNDPRHKLSPQNSPKYDSRSPTQSPSLDKQMPIPREDPRLKARCSPPIQRANTDPRMESRMREDPRLPNQRTDPRLNKQSDPRFNSSRVDPRLASSNSDPRIPMTRTDPRLDRAPMNQRPGSPNNDPRMQMPNPMNQFDSRVPMTHMDPRMNHLPHDSRNMNPTQFMNPDPRMPPRPFQNQNDPRLRNDPRMSEHNFPMAQNHLQDPSMGYGNNYGQHNAQFGGPYHMEMQNRHMDARFQDNQNQDFRRGNVPSHHRDPRMQERHPNNPWGNFSDSNHQSSHQYQPSHSIMNM